MHNSMPAATNAASAAPARSRQVVSCGLDRGFLAAGGVGWVAGQAAGATSPSEKPVAGADAAWAMDGCGMDTTGEGPPLQCADIQRQQWAQKTYSGPMTRQLHVWQRAECRLSYASRHVPHRVGVCRTGPCWPSVMLVSVASFNVAAHQASNARSGHRLACKCYHNSHVHL